MFSVINKHLAGGESTKKMRRKKSGKRAKSAGKRSRIQSDGKGGITLGKKRSKNISIAKLRKRKGAAGGENPKKKQKLQFQPGQKVRLSHPSFQGKLAIVDKYLERKQKYGLKLKGGKKICVEAKFLNVPAKKKKTAAAKAPALGGFTKTITQDSTQPTAETSSGARVTFSGGQITLNKSAKGKGKGKANRKRKQAGGLAAKALTGITLTTAADGGREAKRAKTAAAPSESAATRTAPSVVKPKAAKKKKPKKKQKPKKAGLGPAIEHYQAKGGALVLVRNLPKSVAGHHLIMDLFPDAGEILSSIVHTDAKGKSTGSGEVHFARLREAQKAIADMRGTVYGGNKISMTLIGTQQGGRMTSEVQVEKQELDSEDEYESEYDEEEPQEEEEKVEPTAEPEAQESQSGEEGEPEEEEDEDDEAEEEAEEAPEESAGEESNSEAPPPADAGGLDYIEPSDSEEDDGPEFHVTLKGGLGLQG